MIDCDVAPFDQRYETPLDAVSVTCPPVQNVVGPEAVTVAVAEPHVTQTFANA